MKLLFAPFLALLLCTSCATASRVPATAQAAAPQADTLAAESFAYADTSGNVRSSVTAFLPTASTPLADSIRAFANRALADDAAFATWEGNKHITRAFSGDLRDAQSLVNFYGRENHAALRASLKEMQEENPEAFSDMRLDYTITVRKESETPRYVNYNVNSYQYSGGAHGGSTIYTTTFLKPSGKQLSYPIDTTRLEDLQPILRAGAARYFVECGETSATAANIYRFLLIDPTDPIPLPAFAPCLTPAGVSFTYQQYEIACYAAGLVSFTVPYDQIRPFLTADALRAIE